MNDLEEMYDAYQFSQDSRREYVDILICFVERIFMRSSSQELYSRGPRSECSRNIIAPFYPCSASCLEHDDKIPEWVWSVK